MSDKSGVFARARRIRADRRVTVGLLGAFLVGLLPGVATFTVADGPLLPWRLLWLLPTVPLFAYAMLDLGAAVATIRHHPEYNEWGWRKRVSVWNTLLFDDHYALRWAFFTLFVLAFVGIFFAIPFTILGVLGFLSAILAGATATPAILTSDEDREDLRRVE